MLFVEVRPRLPVIANQRARWCGNPPVREEMYQQLPYKVGKRCVFGGSCHMVPFSRGIATPVCALARNDSIYSTNNNLSIRRSGVLCYGQHYTTSPALRQPTLSDSLSPKENPGVERQRGLYSSRNTELSSEKIYSNRILISRSSSSHCP